MSPQDSLIVDAVQPILSAQSEIYGANSQFRATVIERAEPVANMLGWVPSWQYSLLVVCFIVLLLLCLYRYGTSIKLLLSNFISVPATQNMLEAANVEFNDFLRYSKILSFLGLSIVFTGIIYYTQDLDKELFYVLIVVSLGVLLSAIVSVATRKIIALFDYNSKRLGHIASVYSLDPLVFALFLALPTFIFLSIPVARLALILLLCLFYFLHIVKIFYIFSQQRFSFLQTFLYLCTVEIVPFTLSWGILTEYNIL